MTHKSTGLILLTAALGATYLVAGMIPPRDRGEMAIQEFGRLPIVAGGREKPFDTYARNTLMMISDRQTFYDDSIQEPATWRDWLMGRSGPQPTPQPATKWLLDSIAGRPEAGKHRVFRIDNFELLDFLGLEARTDSKYKFRYAITEFADKEDKLREAVLKAQDTPEAQQSVFQRKASDLWQKIQRFAAVVQCHEPLIVPSLEAKSAAASAHQWKSLIDVLMHGLNWTDPEQRFKLGAFVMKNKAELLERMSGDEDPAVRSVAKILAAYQRGDAAAFNTELAAYQRMIGMAMPATVTRADREFIFNSFAPFYRCMVLYVAALVLVLVGLLRWGRTLNRAALALAGVTLIAHTVALIFRMYLLNRWGVFVTNLYSSAIFIGWAAVGLALLLEFFYRRGIGTMVAAIAGFSTLLIAHNLAADGKDTLEMMEAVLDTNFWLATHVTAVTLGYTATFVAGFLGILYILFGLFSRQLDAATSKDLATMTYGTICFAILLSFTGTVLGGIWADQSWGRFWGWDPKENGALMIVLWNGLILHARWGALVRQRGLAVMAVFGNIVTAWSWFGVNELGAGLHSYGFTEGRTMWLLLFVASQIVLMGLSLIPARYWRSSVTSRRRPEDVAGEPQPLPA